MLALDSPQMAFDLDVAFSFVCKRCKITYDRGRVTSRSVCFCAWPLCAGGRAVQGRLDPAPAGPCVPSEGAGVGPAEWPDGHTRVRPAVTDLRELERLPCACPRLFPTSPGPAVCQALSACLGPSSEQEKPARLWSFRSRRRHAVHGSMPGGQKYCEGKAGDGVSSGQEVLRAVLFEPRPEWRVYRAGSGWGCGPGGKDGLEVGCAVQGSQCGWSPVKKGPAQEGDRRSSQDPGGCCGTWVVLSDKGAAGGL